jgi:DNA-binding transcriptional ArsR family regulator
MTPLAPARPNDDLLERIFHEPTRMAVMSALCAAETPLPFVQLRDECRLTDGNLSRHLGVLEEAGAVRIRKSFRDNKPLTTVEITREGWKRFDEYLKALSRVLEKARQSMTAAPARPATGALARRAPAHG